MFNIIINNYYILFYGVCSYYWFVKWLIKSKEVRKNVINLINQLIIL